MPFQEEKGLGPCTRCGAKRTERFLTPAGKESFYSQFCRACSGEVGNERRAERAAKGENKPAAPKPAAKKQPAPKKTGPAKDKAQFGHESRSRSGRIRTRRVATAAA